MQWARVWGILIFVVGKECPGFFIPVDTEGRLLNVKTCGNVKCLDGNGQQSVGEGGCVGGPAVSMDVESQLHWDMRATKCGSPVCSRGRKFGPSANTPAV